VDIGPDKIICPRISVPAGVSVPGATYKWTGPNGFQSTQDIIAVSMSGVYRVEVLNRSGCLAADEMGVTAKEDLLKADFLMTSKAFVRDTVVMLDISMPAPDEARWSADEKAKIITRTPDRLEAVFLSPGTYSVGLSASLLGCQSSSSQSILIADRPADEPQGGRRAAEENPLSVYPNPSDKILNVDVKLPDASEALIEIFSLSHKGSIMSKTLAGEKEYTLAFDIGNCEPGLYVVALHYGNRIFRVKVIKQ